MPLRGRTKFSREKALKAKPLRNEAVSFQKNGKGEACLILERGNVWWLKILSSLFSIPRERKIALDEIGSSVYEMCDGKNTVKEMIEKLSSRYKLNSKEVELSLLSYLKKLGEKGIIGFVMEVSSDGEKSGSRASDNPPPLQSH